MCRGEQAKRVSQFSTVNKRRISKEMTQDIGGAKSSSPTVKFLLLIAISPDRLERDAFEFIIAVNDSMWGRN